MAARHHVVIALLPFLFRGGRDGTVITTSLICASSHAMIESSRYRSRPTGRGKPRERNIW